MYEKPSFQVSDLHRPQSPFLGHFPCACSKKDVCSRLASVRQSANVEESEAQLVFKTLTR
eukprot:5972244-Amphidinium_carterae.4